jgi:murein DD-endopeptidase MepM/ murein hydrolase activator NlpD
MQFIPEELLKAISTRLKAGDRKPVCRVEVDRMAFIPGRVEEVEFLVQDSAPVNTVQDTWFDSESSGISKVNSVDIVFPVRGRSLADVSSRFGKRGSGFHSGIDIAANVGESVLAAWDGKVKVVSFSNLYNGYGRYIDIVHEGGVVTRYAHLHGVQVRVGETVKAGDIIGSVGNTGNVRYNGKPVTGSYSDPNSERAKGLGSHLHFEIRLPDSKGGTTAVDPEPYLKGTNKLFTKSTNTGTVNDGDIYIGFPGEIRLNERFVSKDWYKASMYTVDANFKNYSSVSSTSIAGYSGTAHSFVFDPKKVKSNVVTGFNIKLEMNREGSMDIGYISTLGSADRFNVYVNGKLVRTINEFPYNKLQQLKAIYIPKGSVTIRLEVKWTRGSKVQYFALTNIFIQELRSGTLEGLKTLDKFINSDAVVDYWDMENIESFVFSDTTNKVQLQVGQFVYMDTLVLDNVQSVDIESQYEMESAEARIVLVNKEGIYNPDYEPGSFPDFYKESPWSYYVNGTHVSVLSENTPIRIYLGYGNNLMRVFTGLIDKVDIVGDTITITAYDMYKKIREKVLTETKAYPKEIDPVTTSSLDNLSRREKIIYAAQQQASKFGVDYKFLLAIAQHETGMGTLGWGRPEQGDYILGYGAYSTTDADPAYAGIDKQMYYGAKRMKEALASRGGKVSSYDDVEYFRKGGDLGTAYTWTPDTNWSNSVWQIYQDILSNPSNWTVNVSGDTSDVEGEKVAWVKSAVVQDLVAHAGMFGWRANAEDLNYPDAVIEETYLIDVNQATGMVLRALPGIEGEFVIEPASSILTPQGWLNPFVEEYGKTFKAYEYKVSDCINEVIQDLNYRSYCDRYGTYRLERIRLNKPVVAEFKDTENLITISKTIDMSRSRSHLIIVDDSGKEQHYIDKEILMDLKGELRTAVISVPWAKTEAMKREVAKKAFFDMKRLAKTLQVSIVGNPALDILDNVAVIDRNTTTRSVYTIKGIRHSFSVENGYIQVIDLTWLKDGQVV